MIKRAGTGVSMMALAAAGLLALSGCSSDDGSASAETTATSAPSSASAPSTQTSSPGSTPAAPNPDAGAVAATLPVDLDRALQVASDTAPGGTITKIELEFDRRTNVWVWKIDSQNNTEQREIKIDAQSAQVISDERDQESAGPMAVDPRKLSPTDALRLATDLVPGSVESWALEYDDGRQRYSFDIRSADGSEADVDVDVDTRVATRS